MEEVGKQEAMEKLDRKLNLWIRERLIPRLVEDEPSAKFTRARPTGSFFISDLFFVTVHTTKNNGNKSAVVKLPLRNPEVSLNIEYNGLFANEILFYKEIAHNHDKDYPKCYLAGKDPIFTSVIVLEDVRPRGYAVCPQKVNVELDYVKAGLRSIAKFHGHTYAIKEKEPARFREIVQSISKIRYTKMTADDRRLQKCMNDEVERLVRALRAKHPDAEFAATMSKVLEDAYSNVVMKCVEPAEPLATIVHGDCTVNNLLYRTGDDGELESMLIDFGLVMYSSPAIDVATFLYLTCKREDIRDRSEELFTVYHDSLTECMKEHGIWDPSKYSRQAFWQDYRERAIFGYVAAAVFFRYVMMAYDRDNVIPQISDSWIEQYFKSIEGQDLLDELIGMLDDLRAAGMLDLFIKKCK